jgi:RNA polymerase sigma-70 factor, ECF subfamily
MAPNEMSDAVLLTLVAAGDGRAMGLLYQRHAPRLRAVALKVLRHRADAEDVVHDVFVSLLATASLYVPERGAVASWLLVHTRNRAIDRVRAQSRRTQRSRLAQASGAVDGESIGHRAAMVGKVEQALLSVDERQRRMLRLAYVEGLSLPEIAQRERTRLGTVKSRSARAIAALRDAVDPQLRPPKVGIGPVVGRPVAAGEARVGGAGARDGGLRRVPAEADGAEDAAA